MNEHRREAVVVTGASSGIGAGAALLLAREGFIAFACVRNDADAARAATLNEHVRPLRLDVTDRDSIDEAARHVAESGHVLRGVVCNAGIAVAGPMEFLPVDELRRQFEINVFGAVARRRRSRRSCARRAGGWSSSARSRAGWRYRSSRRTARRSSRCARSRTRCASSCGRRGSPSR